MITILNALPFPLVCAGLIFGMLGCFFGAYKYRKKRQNAETILFAIFGLLPISTIFFQYARVKEYDSLIQNISSWILGLHLVIVIITMYIYALYRYRKVALPYAERQKMLLVLVGIPVLVLYVIIMVFILGI